MSAFSLVDAVKARYGSADDTVYAADAFLVGDKNRRRNKTWEMVGMEKTREKQSQHSKILTLGLSEASITIAQHHESEISEAELLRVNELDLSGNTALTLEQCDIIVSNLPACLACLQLAQIPSLFPPETATAPPPSAPLFQWKTLRKLILNSTGFVHLGQLQLLHLPNLDELHLDNNSITTLIPPQGALAAGWSLSTVTTLSLGGNRFSSLESSGIPEALETIFTSCTKLFLTENDFCDLAPEGDDVTAANVLERLAPSFNKLTLLCLNNNKHFASPKNLELIRQLCPLLNTFRVTYQYVFPKISETQARMMVVASLPTITVLNRGTVRPKERLDSELFYVQRGLAEADDAVRLVQFPLTKELREKHKDVVLSLAKEGETASSIAHVMLSVELCCDGCLAANKVLPSSITVGKLKSLVRTVFAIEPQNQVLGFWNSDQARVTAPTPLDNELQTLAYFGVGNGAVIRVQDMSVR